ncbi:MAG: peroxidase family protein, partial [Miltoncostaeaceae bacterium]
MADTRFILDQITLSEAHAATEDPTCVAPLTVAKCATPGTQTITGPAVLVGGGTQGVRQVDGRNNNLSTGFSPWNGAGYNASVTGNSVWGAADQFFPTLTGLVWLPATIDGGGPTTYANRGVNVVDSAPRTVSNLIVDQSPANPAAVAAGGTAVPEIPDGSVPIRNQAPAGGVAPPYNGMFALFGQFFDHGLDLVDKGPGYVKVNLQTDDPLYQPGRSMFLTRTTLNGSLQARNTTTPWIDQNQTYTSHPSHQVFLREYVCSNPGATNVCDAAHPPVATGKLADTTNAARAGNLANWTEIKQQAHDKLGINLDDYDVNDVPVVLTDEYGRFIRGPQGFPMLVRANGTDLAEGNPASMAQTVDFSAGRTGTPPQNLVLRTGHAFVNDMAQGAGPLYACTAGVTCTINSVGIPAQGIPGFNPAILGPHFVMGDGRGNENIGLTAIHTVFHAEHNRLADDLKAVIASTGDAAYIAQWHVDGNAANDWDGERLLQGARLITEMEYQHLVFGEFARLVEPGIAAFTQYNPTLRPDISAEFAHAVYRFGHSMLNPTVERELANGTQVHTPLLGAFTNPALFNDNGSGGNLTGPQAAGAVARGMTGQVGNEIDEFVTNTLRNTLLGQPLDLATLNMLRGRDTGTPPLNEARRQLFVSTNGDPSLAPYTSWAQFGLALRHPQSLKNFIAAYGKDVSISGVTSIAGKRAAAQALMADANFMNGTGAFADVAGKPNTGLEDIDLWVGGLAEKPVSNLAGSMLGPTFAYVFATQLENLQDSDRLYYLSRLEGTNLVNSVEGNTFAEMVMRNTDATSLPVNAFLHPSNIFDMNVAPVPAA